MPDRKNTREAVGLFIDRDRLETAIMDLLDMGFERTDISLLASHESIEATETGGGSLKDRLLPLLDEIRYEVPIVTGGLIALASGPTGAAIAGFVAAAAGAVALKELLDETTSFPDTDRLAEALEEGGALLWVAVTDEKTEYQARKALMECGAQDIHIHEGGAD